MSSNPLEEQRMSPSDFVVSILGRRMSLEKAVGQWNYSGTGLLERCLVREGSGAWRGFAGASSTDWGKEQLLLDCDHCACAFCRDRGVTQPGPADSQELPSAHGAASSVHHLFAPPSNSSA